MMVAAAQEPVVSPIGTLRKILEFLMQNGNLQALARLDIPCSVPAESQESFYGAAARFLQCSEQTAYMRHAGAVAWDERNKAIQIDLYIANHHLYILFLQTANRSEIRCGSMIANSNIIYIYEISTKRDRDRERQRGHVTFSSWDAAEAGAILYPMLASSNQKKQSVWFHQTVICF